MKGQIRDSVAQQIVETVKDVSGHDVNFIDPNGIVFASTDRSRVGDFHEIGRQVVKTDQVMEVETDDSFFGTHKGVNLPFRYQGEVIAAIGISGPPDEVRKYAYLAQKITALILREHELDEQSNDEKAQLNYMIRSLILGESINYDYYMDFLQKRRIDPGESFATVLAQIDTQNTSAQFSAVESAIYQVFEQTGAKLFTFSYPNEYILLIETQRLKRQDYLIEQLARSYPGILKIGVGNSDTLTRQNLSYQAAKIALASLVGEQTLAYFDQLNLEILLGTIPQGAKRRFLEKTVSALDDKDRGILKAYFDCGMSLKATGTALFMHKNTLQYQLDRIWRTCGYNPRSFQDAVVLYLGLKLLL